MKKIEMKTPLVEMNGDEMTRVLWDDIKKILLIPFVDLKTEYFDLSLPERNRTQDAVTHEAAQAIIRYGVGVKCATITPNAQRMEEYGLDKLWPSPNATIRAALDGTVFREPILVSNIPGSVVIHMRKNRLRLPRHRYGDVYKCTELTRFRAGWPIFFSPEGRTVVRAEGLRV
jgi:isocitrate dehydrogenase